MVSTASADKDSITLLFSLVITLVGIKTVSVVNVDSNIMREFFKRLGQELLRLTAFLTCIIFYFAFVRDDGNVVVTTILKCAPIVSLGAYVYLKGFEFSKQYRYSHLIIIGLIFSCIGDLLLNVDLFPWGMTSFAVAQILYIIAFKLKPWKIVIGIPLYMIAIGMTAYVFSYLDVTLKIGLPIYGFLLTTMCWRCIVRAIVRRDVLAIVCAIGSVLFVISDSLICVTMFVTHMANERIIIMSTYYAAQLFISLSTLSDVQEPIKSIA